MDLEELHHRRSFYLDFHTRKALADVRPVLAELQRAFRESFEVLQAPDENGSGFRGTLRLPSGEVIVIEILSNYEDVGAHDLIPSSLEPRLRRITKERYLADKLQCIIERAEARDLVDIEAVVRIFPYLSDTLKPLVERQDALILAERLLSWTEDAIRKDLSLYPDADPQAAMRTRDLLLGWLRSGRR